MPKDQPASEPVGEHQLECPLRAGSVELSPWREPGSSELGTFRAAPRRPLPHFVRFVSTGGTSFLCAFALRTLLTKSILSTLRNYGMEQPITFVSRFGGGL